VSLVLDTCALLYWTLEPARLSAAATAALDRLARGERLILSSASIWEIALKHRAGKLDLGTTPEDYLRRLGRLPVDVEPVSAALWLASVGLDWEHRDPVDRLVVALAAERGAPLLTSDEKIRAWYASSVW